MIYLASTHNKAISPMNIVSNFRIANITDFASGTPPANNIFMAYQMAQGTNPGSTILINTPFYLDPNSAQSKALPSFESVLKPPVQPVYDANYAALIGLNAPNGLIVYPVQL
jgi:hypothetical protein